MGTSEGAKLARLLLFPTTGAGAVPLLPESEAVFMIRKLKSGEYRLYSRKKDAKTGKRKNLGTFRSLDAAKQHEREVQFFKRG